MSVGTWAASVHRKRMRTARVRQRGTPFERARRRLFLPFVGPALILYGLIMIAPMVFNLWVSVNHWAGAGAFTFVGFDNYAFLASDPVFRESFVNTILIVVVGGVGVFAVSFFLTMLLRNMFGKRYLRLIVFFPSIVPGVVVSILWGFMFNQDGLVNLILGAIGIQHPPLWLSQDNMLWIVILGLVWLHAGVYTTVLTAAADRIPPELYEASELDGASSFRQFRSITLPLLMDVVTVCAILWCESALKVFEFILVFGGASSDLPPTAVWNIALYSYASAFDPKAIPRFGVAAACGVVLLCLTLVLSVFARRITRADRITY